MPPIRPAAPEDLRAVENIYRLALQDANWLPPTDRLNADFAKSSEGEKVFVCGSDLGDILGFISIWQEGSYIHHLYVCSASQRKGIGTALIESLKSWLPKPWCLKCVAANTKALHFYKHQGFETVSEHDDANPPYILLRSEA